MYHKCMMKFCKKCNTNRYKKDFYKRKASKDGLANVCKYCQKEVDKNRYLQNREQIINKKKVYNKKISKKIKNYRKIYNKEHQQDISKYNKEWRKDNPKYNLEWKKENRDLTASYAAKRRAQKLQATPNWLTEEHGKQIEQFYIEAQKLTKETGIPHEVDHIIPLQGRNVSGLHVPWNLQILTKSENCRKSNKLIN